MLYYNDYWRHGQSPPTDIFQTPQTVTLLFAALFFFDGIRVYPLSNLWGYSRTPLNYVGKICGYFPFRTKFYKKQREISASVGKWCAIRAPPLGNLKAHFLIQVSGGTAMSKISKRKNFLKFFWNHQVSLGVSQLGLFIEPIVEGG